MAGGSGGAARIAFAACVIGLSAFVYVKFHHLLTLAGLRANHSAVVELVAAYPTLAPACYIGTLIVVIGLTCPGATMLSFIGGVFFKQPYASLYAYIGYIIGATVSYVVTTFILGDYMRQKLAANSQLFTKFEKNVRKNAFLYLVVARFTLVFPFFFVNGAAALVGVHWRTFVAATTMSCIPGAVIYTTAGGALANMLHALGDNDDVDKSKLIWMALDDPNVRCCMGGLAFAMCVLMAAKFYQSKEEEEEASKED